MKDHPVSREKPILFSGSIIQAILQGRKTQTRRPIKPQPKPAVWESKPCEVFQRKACRNSNGGQSQYANTFEPDWPQSLAKFAPWSVGDHLWVRETWGIHKDFRHHLVSALGIGLIGYGADYDEPQCQPTLFTPWRPSIHMPRKFSRITLEVTRVWAERLQDISPADVAGEGTGDVGPVGINVAMLVTGTKTVEDCSRVLHCDMFAMTWDGIYAKRGFPWSANPWVWAIEFKVSRKARVR